MTECHSTNDELSKMMKGPNAFEGTIVFTDHQKGGKGQRGNVWLDEPGKNVLMSVLLKPNYLLVNEQYFLNIVVGLAVVKTTSRYLASNRMALKWPNDVLASNKKICGILIENSIRRSGIESAVVGIGYNLNQSSFKSLNATSLSLESGAVGRRIFIENLLVDLEYFILKLKAGKKQELLDQYYASLHLKDVPAKYEDKAGQFDGIIQGIDETGRLGVKRVGGVKYYGIKEIKFLGR